MDAVANEVGQAKTSQGPAPLQQGLTDSRMISSQNNDTVKDLKR